MRMLFALAVALCGCSRPAPEPVPPQPAVSPEPVVAAEPEGVEPSVTEAAPCPMGAPRAELDACLADVAPGDSFTAVDDPKPAFGYVCVFFGTQGRPRCREGEVDVLRRWRDESDAECPKTLAVYWAPHEGRPPVEAQELPGSHLRMRTFPSDGTQFSFIRLDDHMVEATSCLDAAEEMQTELVGWATRLMSAGPGPTKDVGGS